MLHSRLTPMSDASFFIKLGAKAFFTSEYEKNIKKISLYR